MAANKVLNSDLSSPNSVYNGMSIGNSLEKNKKTKKKNNNKQTKNKKKQQQIFFNNYHRELKAVR